MPSPCEFREDVHNQDTPDHAVHGAPEGPEPREQVGELDSLDVAYISLQGEIEKFDPSRAKRWHGTVHPHLGEVLSYTEDGKLVMEYPLYQDQNHPNGGRAPREQPHGLFVFQWLITNGHETRFEPDTASSADFRVVAIDTASNVPRAPVISHGSHGQTNLSSPANEARDHGQRISNML